MNNFNKEQNGKSCGAFCMLACCGIACMAFVKCVDHVTDKFASAIGSKSEYDYADAVEAIMESTMFSMDKKDAVVALRPGKDAGFYKTIIYIAKLDVLSGDKLRMIKELSAK